MTKTLVPLFALLASSLTVGCGGGGDGKQTARIVAPSEVVGGMSYGQWAEAWWSWSGSFPKGTTHPLNDPTTASCSAGNSGEVWFLGGTFESKTVTRTCTVPKDTYLFFPLVNIAPNNFNATPALSCQDLKDQAALYGNTPIDLAFEFDDQTITDFAPYHILSSQCFDVTAVTDSPVSSTDSGTKLAADNGYYVMVGPMTAGTHTLKMKGGLQFNMAQHGFDETFSVEANYTLTVTP